MIHTCIKTLDTVQYKQRYFFFYKINNRIGFKHDRIGLMHDRTRYMNDKKGFIHDRKE